MLGHQLVFLRALAAPMKPRNNGCARLGRTAAGAAPVISKPSGSPCGEPTEMAKSRPAPFIPAGPDMLSLRR